MQEMFGYKDKVFGSGRLWNTVAKSGSTNIFGPQLRAIETTS